MVADSSDITDLTLEEVSAVVSKEPWYSGARMERCRRMASLGEDAWDSSRYSDHALYIPSRRLVFAQLERSRRPQQEPEAAQAARPKPSRQIFVLGGDYFSQEQYDSVKQQDDNIFASFAGKASKPAGELELHEEFTDFCTESLAKVYADQGYTDKAVEIYSKLSLRYPEKSVYFASLIEKTEKKI